ncbi:peptide synthetase [Sinomonas albida]|uniref:peptide synthetase n=1 Tax=Sinomonas albida TaxID=369942 RepID=UPI0010A75A55|nr:peptide synthetase [Sinomonas albida]
MRLTTVAQMALPEGSLQSFAVRATPDPTRELPVSFDQSRHVGRGDRAGSWMAVSFRLAQSPSHAVLADAWRAAIARHGTLRTVFSAAESGVRLHEATVDDGVWREHEASPGATTREALHALLDAECRPFAAPSYLLAMVVPSPAEPDPRPVVVLASDHAHVDMWSLLILAHEVRSRVDGEGAGGDATSAAAPADPLPAAFVDHTRALAAMPEAPVEVIAHWEEILRAGGGAMPVFPLSLGDVSTPSSAIVEVRDVLDVSQLARLEEQARAREVRILPLVLSELAQLFRDVADAPLRAVFPVHSRNEPRWRDSVGWYITNAVLDVGDPAPASCAAAVGEAVRLGAFPLAPIFDRIGGTEPPGMFALSWLDVRRLPLRIEASFEPQFVSAELPTDNLMIWFIVNDDGLHLRCRYPSNAVARATVSSWLDELTNRIATVARAEPDEPPRPR